MDTSNIIALVLGGTGFIISIISLVLAPRLALKSKRLEKRMEYRFELYQKILVFWEFTHNNQISNQNGFEPLMKEVNKFIQLYGLESEIKSFTEVVNSYNSLVQKFDETNKQIFETKCNDFLKISFNAYRKELVLGKLES